jgi:hypothetical protein
VLGACNPGGEASDAPSGGSGGAALASGGSGPGAGGASSAGGAASVGGAVPAGGAVAVGGASFTGGRSGSAGGGVGVGGSVSTGGAAPGDSLCGEADEGESVRLECPEGQFIAQVTFASYGTPSGACGSFVEGDCHSDTSQSRIESQCVGRGACTIGAGNGNFGDPCNKVPKSLAVEVECALGEPTVESGGPYKGVANSPATEIAELGATWCYNWGTTPAASDCDDPLFVPMVWGSGNVAAAIASIGQRGYRTVLAFNEPNKSDQANMTVDQAIALWPDLTSDPEIRVSSPAVSDDGRAWLEEFMDRAQEEGLRVDFVAMHWYGWNAGSCTRGQFEGAVNWASQWGLPVWITEFGCMGSSNPDQQTLLDFFDAALPMLNGNALVERYAWYPWNDYNHLFEGGEITALGEAFKMAPGSRD